ncbi:MAG: hypothetical protein ACYTGF_12185 [Planctomycetota bacterium]
MSKALAALWALTLAVPAAGQTAYPLLPDWESLNPHYSTGAALVDIDRDGWLDLVVSTSTWLTSTATAGPTWP